MDKSFDEKISKYIPDLAVTELYSHAISYCYHHKHQAEFSDRKQIIRQIDILEERLKNARKKYADDQLQQDDFYALKKDTETAIRDLETRLAGVSNQTSGIDDLINQALGKYFRLNFVYKSGTIAEKRNIIGSIFPEKLTFDGSQHRTARINEVVELIYTVGAAFSEIKNGTSDNFSHLYHQVNSLG